jgi:hypothetical protein
MFAIDASVIGVSANPGQIAFTVTACPASSTASTRVKPSTPCFAAVYAAV